MVAMVIIMLAGGAIDTRREFIEMAQCEAAKAKIHAEFTAARIIVRPVITCVALFPE